MEALPCNPDGGVGTTGVESARFLDCCAGSAFLGCLKGVSKSVQVLLNGIEAVMVLSSTILK